MTSCENVCMRLLRKLEDAGEDIFTETYDDKTGNLIRSKVCETDHSGINHDEFLERLEKYNFTLNEG